MNEWPFLDIGKIAWHFAIWAGPMVPKNKDKNNVTKTM